jgi:hypothetical protein
MNTIINTHYPIDYFGVVEPTQTAPLSGFWASEELFAPAEDFLEISFGSFRPVNFIDFQICQKPINFRILYQQGTEWLPIQPTERFPFPTFATAYMLSATNPWTHWECRFDLIITNKMRIEFIRRTERFPDDSTPEFAWSIEVKSLRFMHVITEFEDFVPDIGKDILDNVFISDVDAAVSDNVIDDDDTTYWQSQANPIPDSVEALFFDLRGGFEKVTMKYLDPFITGILDNRGMRDMEEYYSDPVLIDEVWIDPITTGPLVHFYYSNDDEPDPNNKLWIPIPRHYILKRGYYAFPQPIFCKYVKVEFTNLAPAPYNSTQYPFEIPITTRRFPTWVRDYFRQLYLPEPSNNFFNPLINVDINILDMGFQSNTIRDLFDTEIEFARDPLLGRTLEDPKEFISTINISEDRKSSDLFDKIQFNSPFMWQRDLISELDTTRALTRFVFSGQSGWQTEGGVPISEPVAFQSQTDLTEELQEKQMPPMFFPRKCRHGYQEVQLPRQNNVCYFVAIKEVTFYRRDYRVQYDEPFYIETFEDEVHIEQNEFEQDDWRAIVTP